MCVYVCTYDQGFELEVESRTNCACENGREKRKMLLTNQEIKPKPKKKKMST